MTHTTYLESKISEFESNGYILYNFTLAGLVPFDTTNKYAEEMQPKATELANMYDLFGAWQEDKNPPEFFLYNPILNMYILLHEDQTYSAGDVIEGSASFIKCATACAEYAGVEVKQAKKEVDWDWEEISKLAKIAQAATALAEAAKSNNMEVGDLLPIVTALAKKEIAIRTVSLITKQPRT